MAAASTTAPALTRISAVSRIYGLGSIYAKTMRDSRLAFIIVAGLLGGLALFMGAAISTVFPTPASRLEVDKLIGSMPASMVNLFGRPEKLGTLGGYMSWKYGALFAQVAALWSILALSGTLAGEAAKGSLDIVAVAPYGKRRIAIEKLAAHVTMLAIALAIVAIGTTVSSSAFGNPALGDQISALSAVGFALWVGFLALFFGGIAWVLAPILGRGGSAGVAGISLAILWVANGLNTLGPVANLSPFHWTANHIALVGEYDWPGLALVGVVAAVFLVVGIEVFARRDLGITSGLGLPTLPAGVLGVRGPTARAFGDQLPRALSWGIGLGLFGAVLASLVGPMSAQIASDPSLASMIGNIFPAFDLSKAGGFLQLYITLFYIVAGFAAATFVSKWASDETGGRLEELMATPLTRTRWVVSGAVSCVGSVVVLMLLLAGGIALGAGSGGVSAGDAMLGSVSLGLYAIALIGLGIAIGGVWRTSLAAELVALFVVATYLVDLLAPPLNLPDWVHQLALTTHFGQPMVGQWDLTGVVACVAIAIGGTIIGAWGIRRRDISR
jgi:ABC-2 type transport system permease protein